MQSPPWLAHMAQHASQAEFWQSPSLANAEFAVCVSLLPLKYSRPCSDLLAMHFAVNFGALAPTGRSQCPP